MAKKIRDDLGAVLSAELFPQRLRLCVEVLVLGRIELVVDRLLDIGNSDGLVGFAVKCNAVDGVVHNRQQLGHGLVAPDYSLEGGVLGLDAGLFLALGALFKVVKDAALLCNATVLAFGCLEVRLFCARPW